MKLTFIAKTIHNCLFSFNIDTETTCIQRDNSPRSLLIWLIFRQSIGKISSTKACRTREKLAKLTASSGG